MAELNLEYIAQLHGSIVQTICEVSADRQGETPPGEPKTLYIGSAEVCQTLTMLLAEFLESTPGLETPGDIRRLTETIASKLRAGILDIRRRRAETGGEPLPTVIINSN
ncbi:hypothetical protein [Novosphingobium terrae]|uniref:hypothetical protein n=1 Tax=Novosphingobium terrae TaxID=2726189 RepID=UPI00197E8298|nr:hypothetical protein [Novosphingobium terrae]